MSLDSDTSFNNELKKIIFFIIFLLATVLIFWQLSELGWLDILTEKQKIQAVIENLGVFGPIGIILIIAIAIIISPIPSAPVALVSGALYGHTLGTVYVVIGALSGAFMAFFIARKLGYEYVRRKFHSHLPQKIIGSQNTLMVIVFVSRLAPFISFDVVSYAAGLTTLSVGRFILATLLGIIPVSFILAHLGSEMMIGESQGIILSILILGLMAIIPVLINMFYKKNNFKG